MPQYRRPTLAQIAYAAFDARVEARLREGADPAPPVTGQGQADDAHSQRTDSDASSVARKSREG